MANIKDRNDLIQTSRKAKFLSRFTWQAITGLPSACARPAIFIWVLKKSIIISCEQSEHKLWDYKSSFSTVEENPAYTWWAWTSFIFFLSYTTWIGLSIKSMKTKTKAIFKFHHKSYLCHTKWYVTHVKSPCLSADGTTSKWYSCVQGHSCRWYNQWRVGHACVSW